MTTKVSYKQEKEFLPRYSEISNGDFFVFEGIIYKKLADSWQAIDLKADSPTDFQNNPRVNPIASLSVSFAHGNIMVPW